MGTASPWAGLERVLLTRVSIKTFELGKWHILLMDLLDSKPWQKACNQLVNQSIFHDFRFNNSQLSSINIKLVLMLFIKKVVLLLDLCLERVKSLSHVRLFVISWTVAHQAPPSMEFSRHEYWSGLPFPSPGDLPDPGIEPRSPTLQADALLSEPPGKPL